MLKPDLNKKSKKNIDVSLSFKRKIYVVDFFKVDNLSLVNLPSEKETYFITTTKQSPITDFVKDKNISDLIIFCASLGERYLREVADKTKGILYRKSTLDKKIKTDFSIILKNNDIEIRSAETHMKLMLFKSSGNYFVIEGSGNPNISSKNENFSVVNDREMYSEILKFYNKCSKEAIEK